MGDLMLRTKTGMIQVKGPNDVPDGHHYAVLIYSTGSTFVPGDQRSRDCPGHGYPEHTEHYNSFEHWVTTDREVLYAFLGELEQENLRPYSKKEPYVFFEVVKKGKLQLRPEIAL
jgi:hypothetical protein